MDEVVLLDDSLTPCGRAPKLAAHQPPGQLHLAFSLVLLDPAGHLLLQRRSGSKHHFRRRWANACCSHPRPGETIVEAARRRADEELGARIARTREIGRFTYRARDPASGLVEHEHDVVVLISPRTSILTRKRSRPRAG